MFDPWYLAVVELGDQGTWPTQLGCSHNRPSAAEFPPPDQSCPERLCPGLVEPSNIFQRNSGFQNHQHQIQDPVVASTAGVHQARNPPGTPIIHILTICQGASDTFQVSKKARCPNWHIGTAFGIAAHVGVGRGCQLSDSLILGPFCEFCADLGPDMDSDIEFNCCLRTMFRPPFLLYKLCAVG